MKSEQASSNTAPLPGWARELISLYESDGASQFILYGNVNDRLVLPLGASAGLGGLSDFLQRVLLPRFDVILNYDLGNGIRVDKGGPIFSDWPYFKQTAELPKAPRPAVEALTQYFRYSANLAGLGRTRYQIGCVMRDADLVAPNLAGGFSYDLNALALLIRDWGTDGQLAAHSLATFLVAENLNDLHPLLVNNPRVVRVHIPLPAPSELQQALTLLAPQYPTALQEYRNKLDILAEQFAGATLNAVVTLLKVKEHARQPLTANDLAQLKKELVERDCNGLIEFIESAFTLDDLYGLEKVKAWLRQDLKLWAQNDLDAMSKGYLLCGPVGTGKTFLIECLAGEAGVPVVKLKNFRDRWVGSTEGNLEKIFRLLHALGRCFVFIDEADQALGKREGGSGDSGVSGRVYSMIAEEMGRADNRGKIVWVLASSRPDLIEVDLKRPGRIDVKIPIFPTTSRPESLRLLDALLHKRGIDIDEASLKPLEKQMPLLLTPGAAETLAVKIYRSARSEGHSPLEALKECLADYQHPVPPEVMGAQIELAVREASDLEFVPPEFRPKRQ